MMNKPLCYYACYGKYDKDNAYCTNICDYPGMCREKQKENIKMEEQTMQAIEVVNRAQIEVANVELLIGGTMARPYYQMKYFNKLDGQYHVGFGSYDIKNVMQWLGEEFVFIEDPDKYEDSNVAFGITVTKESIKTADKDVVREPQHYQHGSYEVIDEMLIAFGPQDTFKFCIMNAWKYRSRAPFKGKMEQDMDKANRYMEMAEQIREANPDSFTKCELIKQYRTTRRI